MLGDRDYMRSDWRGGIRRRPYAEWSLTFKLLLLLGVIFLVQVLSYDQVTAFLVLSAQQLRLHRYWTPVTAVLLHGSFFHLLFNGWALWFFGRQVEEIVGRRHYLALFLLCGLAGNGLWLVANWQTSSSLLGASGAVMGIAGAAAIYFPRQPVMLLFPPVTLQMRTLVICYALLDLLLEFSQAGTGIGHLAHLGGLAAGVLYTLYLRRSRHSRGNWFAAFWQRLRHSRRPAAKPTAARYSPTDLRWLTPEFKPTPDPLADMNEEETMAHIDAILDKISREGLKSLTARERQLLERAGDRIKRSP